MKQKLEEPYEYLNPPLKEYLELQKTLNGRFSRKTPDGITQQKAILQINPKTWNNIPVPLIEFIQTTTKAISEL